MRWEILKNYAIRDINSWRKEIEIEIVKKERKRVNFRERNRVINTPWNRVLCCGLEIWLRFISVQI